MINVTYAGASEVVSATVGQVAQEDYVRISSANIGLARLQLSPPSPAYGRINPDLEAKVESKNIQLLHETVSHLIIIEFGFTLNAEWHNKPLYICDQNANRSNIAPHVGPNSEAHSELVILIQASVTPSAAKSLLDKGYTINVERSPARIFKDEEFEAAGATLVPEGSWVGQTSTADILLLTQTASLRYPSRILSWA